MTTVPLSSSGSTLERQLMSIEAAKRAKASGEPVPPHSASGKAPKHAAVQQATAAAQRAKSASASPSSPAVAQPAVGAAAAAEAPAGAFLT